MGSGINTAVALKYLKIMSLTNTLTLLLKPACVVPWCACSAVPPGLTCLALRIHCIWLQKFLAGSQLLLYPFLVVQQR